MRTSSPRYEVLQKSVVSPSLRNCTEYGKDVRTLAGAVAVIVLLCGCSVKLRKLKSITIWAKPANGEL